MMPKIMWQIYSCNGSFQEIAPKTGNNNITPILVPFFDKHFTMEAVLAALLSSTCTTAAAFDESAGYEESCHHCPGPSHFRLDYCNSLLCGLPSILIKILQRVQSAGARVIAKADRRDHIPHQFSSNFIGYRSNSTQSIISCY